MEHDDKVLPIPIRTLGRHAMKCNALAKALHYKELECQAEQTEEIVEDLIRINNELQQPDVATGILITARDHWKIELKEDWYEKLERWDDALASYTRKAELNPDDWSAQSGRMRCLHALGDWDTLSALARDIWPKASTEYKRRMGPLAAAAAWGMQQMDEMEDYISPLKHDSPDRAWFRAVLNVHRGQIGKANGHINKARDLLDPELTSLIGESYTRAYNQVVRIQMLAELEEVIQFKDTFPPSEETKLRRIALMGIWSERLRGCQPEVDVWQRVLKVRSLVLTPRENMQMWIKFANLCRKNGRLALAEKTINSLLGEDDADSTVRRWRQRLPDVVQQQTSAGPPHVIYTHLKLMWAKGEREDTLSYLRDFAQHLSSDLGLDTGGPTNQELLGSPHLADYTHLLARCYFKLGEWQMAQHDDWGAEHVQDVLRCYMLSTRLDPKWYKGWHAWALANSEVVSHYARNQSTESDAPIPQEIFTGHLVPSVRAFFQSIALSPSSSLQDTLRLLTLWFKYGQHAEISAAVHDGFNSVGIDTWLDVIPQLIARIHSPHSNIRRLIHQLLADIGKAHPQALVYALTVASKYPNLARRRAAMNIIDKMREHCPLLVEQALMVSEELIRVAILWHEQWHVGLEEASRLYYGDHNIEAMFGVLEPLHEMIERGPETLREMSFVQAHGRDLADARECCRRYRMYGETGDLNQAWDLYYHVRGGAPCRI